MILQLKKKLIAEERKIKVIGKRKEKKIIKGRIKGIEDTTRGKRKKASEKLSQKIGTGILRKGNRGERNRMEQNIGFV